MPEMHLRQIGFKCSACGPFTKIKERIKKIKETEDLRYIYQNKLDKAYFQNDMVYGDLKDINRRAFSDKVLLDKDFKYCYRSRIWWISTLELLKFFDKKKTSGSGIKNESITNKEFAKEIHKPIIRKFNKRKVHLLFIDNVWGADLVDMQWNWK